MLLLVSICKRTCHLFRECNLDLPQCSRAKKKRLRSEVQMSSAGGCCDLRFVDTAAGKVPVVPADWSRRDGLGRLKCRLFNSFRMSYTVEPGIYALGSPDGRSPVLVTANYKLSFDLLRRELAGFAASIWPRLWGTGESSFPSWGHRECRPMR